MSRRSHSARHQRSGRAHLVLRLQARPRPLLSLDPPTPRRHRSTADRPDRNPPKDRPLAPGHSRDRTRPAPPRPSRRRSRPGPHRRLRRSTRRPAAGRPADLRPQLRQAATAFERATRSRVRARHDQARALRGAVRALRTAPADGDGSGLAMFLDMALLAALATVRWHRLRHHDQQVAAAQQTLLHLRAAYGQAAAAPLAALADHRPPTTDRQGGTAGPAHPNGGPRSRGDGPRRPRLARPGHRSLGGRNRRTWPTTTAPGRDPPAHPG